MNYPLTEFYWKQEQLIDKAARQLAMLISINISYDVTQGAKRVIEGNPMLRGVSPREITMRVLDNLPNR